MVRYIALSVTRPLFDSKAALTRSAAFASIATALFLVGLKLWATTRTGSTAMLGSLADTALDLVASIATLVGVMIAAQPPDKRHRFGHGKAESLAAMFQVILIALSAAALGFRAVIALVEGQQTASAEEGIVVSVIAIAATLILISWQRYVVRRTGSVAIKADNVHYQSDLLLNLAVIAALVFDQYVGMTGIDPLFGLAIAGWLLWSAWGTAREAIDSLMDREWPEEKRARLVELAARHPELESLHALRTRTSGTRDFVQFHVDLPGDMTVEHAHKIIDRVQDDLSSHFPDMDLLIHIDPEGHVDEPDNPLLEADEFEKLEKD
ncbi:MAG: cation diffusion facilitator family transporter [Pseudomonadota bacterium]